MLKLLYVLMRITILFENRLILYERSCLFPSMICKLFSMWKMWTLYFEGDIDAT